MQTFLPFNSPAKCAEVLDNKRLNKQILECYQILKVISTNGKAWRNHPAVLMWEGEKMNFGIILWLWLMKQIVVALKLQITWLILMHCKHNLNQIGVMVSQHLEKIQSLEIEL